ncbi:MAG: FAD-dependent monooxygenase [Deltaproteobacteria bacterium]|nr:FAD-dependent monooxygenase [Deltaproteobacteria bacterium]
MRGRRHHQPDGTQLRYAYGPEPQTSICTIERSTLHRRLLEHVLRLSNVEIRFEHRCLHVERTGAEIHFQGPAGPVVVPSGGHLVTGCDGVWSRVRAAVQASTGVPFSVTTHSHRYKALTMNDEATRSLDREAMHVWTHGRQMVVAQPRWDGGFSAALLAPPQAFARLSSPTAIRGFFERCLPTLSPLLARATEDLMAHRVGRLTTVSGRRWHSGNLLVIGDAAHGMVPLFGQGMNASFEDARLLADQMGGAQGDWRRAVPRFTASRVADGRAIARMSHDNYPELAGGDAVQPGLQAWRALEQQMMLRHRDVPVSFHNLVCFSHTPYRKALRCKARQVAMFGRLLRGKRDVSDLDGSTVDAELRAHRSFVDRVARGAA